VRNVLREHLRGARRVAWIDIHTALGPWGHGEKIYAGRDDAATLERDARDLRRGRHVVLRRLARRRPR
jgi:hypothetical protein